MRSPSVLEYTGPRHGVHWLFLQSTLEYKLHVFLMLLVGASREFPHLLRVSI